MNPTSGRVFVCKSHLNSVCDAFAAAAFTGFSNRDACTHAVHERSNVPTHTIQSSWCNSSAADTWRP
jgi:hypothetical protein